MPSTSVGRRPASTSALRTASTAMARVVRPDLWEYSVSPTPTMQYLSRRLFIRACPLSLAVVLGKGLGEELGRVGGRRLRHHFGRTLGDDLAALVSRLGAEIDHVVG